jgi:perosamine synthetase
MQSRYSIPVSRPTLIGREKEYVQDCLDSTWISSNGKYIGFFEKEFAE